MAKSNLASHKLFSWSLIMLLLALTNVSGSLASENYLPLENEGNSRQTRLFASSFKLLWYMWILWLLKVRRTFCWFEMHSLISWLRSHTVQNIPSHCVFYFIKKKHFKEKYPDLVSIEPSEFDETTTTTTRDGAPSQSSHSQTYELVRRNQGIQPQGALLGSQTLLTLGDIRQQAPPQAPPQVLPHFPPQHPPQLQPQVAAIKQQRAFSVTVPPNCPPGTMMMITPPDSQLTFSCQVPHGVKQGDVFQVII